MALLLATSQVYFRDTSSFLPYVSRIWLYLSPVLYYPDVAFRQYAARPLECFNPLFPLLGGWGDLLVRGELDPVDHVGRVRPLVRSARSSSAALVFMSRERDFAVRL